MKTERRVVERDGYYLNVELCGSGPILLIIGSVNYYKRVVPSALHRHFTCLYVDHRGFASGEHQQVNQSVSLDLITEDIEEICRVLGVKKASVLGHSGHAYMAIHFAAHTTLEITKLIVVGAAPSLSTTMQEEQLSHWAKCASDERKKLLDASLPLMESDIAVQPERKFVHICRRLGPMRWADPYFDELPLWEGVAMNTVWLDTLWGEIFRDIDIAQFSANLDLIVICGELDFSVAPIRTWREIERAFRSLALFELKGASHTPMFECPVEFASIMLTLHNMTQEDSGINHEYVS